MLVDGKGSGTFTLLVTWSKIQLSPQPHYLTLSFGHLEYAC